MHTVLQKRHCWHTFGDRRAFYDVYNSTTRRCSDSLHLHKAWNTSMYL